MDVRLLFVVCCVGSGLCDGLISCSEESYRGRVCLIVCSLETSKKGGLGPTLAVAPQQEVFNYGQW